MKKLMALAAVGVLCMTGCATMYPIGSLYTKVNVPQLTGDSKDITYSKVGKAQAVSILTLVATGDASIDAAAKNGNIKTIKYVDYQCENILGIYGTYTTVVYGD